MKTDIILSGVGGQGILSIATIIGQAAMNKNLYIKQAEVHGMSQRGGDVQSNLRISDHPIHSDLITRGYADIIISLEPMEALRYAPYLASDGYIVTSSSPFINIPNYPEYTEIMRELSGYPHVTTINIDKLAQEHNLNKCANVILLGAAAGALHLLEYPELEASIRSVFASKGTSVVDMNLKALALGYETANTSKEDI